MGAGLRAPWVEALAPTLQLVQAALAWFEEAGIRHQGQVFRPMSMPLLGLRAIERSVAQNAGNDVSHRGDEKSKSSLQCGSWVTLGALVCVIRELGFIYFEVLIANQSLKRLSLWWNRCLDVNRGKSLLDDDGIAAQSSENQPLWSHNPFNQNSNPNQFGLLLKRFTFVVTVGYVRSRFPEMSCGREKRVHVHEFFMLWHTQPERTVSIAFCTPL